MTSHHHHHHRLHRCQAAGAKASDAQPACVLLQSAQGRGAEWRKERKEGNEARKADKKTRHMPPALRPHRVRRRAMSKIAETAYTQAPCAPAVARVQIARRCKMSVADSASASVCLNIVTYIHTYTHLRTCISTYIHTCIHTYIYQFLMLLLCGAQEKKAEVSERQLADTDPHNDAWNCVDADPDEEPEAEGARSLCI